MSALDEYRIWTECNDWRMIILIVWRREEEKEEEEEDAQL